MPYLSWVIRRIKALSVRAKRIVASWSTEPQSPVKLNWSIMTELLWDQLISGFSKILLRRELTRNITHQLPMNTRRKKLLLKLESILTRLTLLMLLCFMKIWLVRKIDDTLEICLVSPLEWLMYFYEFRGVRIFSFFN